MKGGRLRSSRVSVAHGSIRDADRVARGLTLLRNADILAAEAPPEVMEEEQGVQARARWPLTLTRGARRTPCSVISDGRLALG